MVADVPTRRALLTGLTALPVAAAATADERKERRSKKRKPAKPKVPHVDVAIVGAGGFGAWTAWHLLREVKRAVEIARERFGLGAVDQRRRGIDENAARPG